MKKKMMSSTINLNDCANGTYLLRIVTNNEIVTSKLIKY